MGVMQLEQLQPEIESLQQKEFMRLRHWFLQKDWERWDRQLEADAASGKLDFLFVEAMSAKGKEMKTKGPSNFKIARPFCFHFI